VVENKKKMFHAFKKNTVEQKKTTLVPQPRGKNLI